PESVHCAQVLRHDSGEPYKDEADAQILVLGDSFTRIYQQDQPTAAGFVAHLAKELKQPLISLINDGGGATLVREELSGRPAFLKGRKVVIWEFVERDIGLALKGWKQITLGAAPARLPKTNS
ncbi:MAG: alginate O-acetyltransferase AlgX-related protein, partial [Limisphaerales bacterium]